MFLSRDMYTMRQWKRTVFNIEFKGHEMLKKSKNSTYVGRNVEKGWNENEKPTPRGSRVNALCECPVSHVALTG